MLKILSLIPDSFIRRIGNRYTTNGSLLLLYVMAQQGIIPLEAVEALEGVPDILPFILGGAGIYLIFKLPSEISNYSLSTKKYLLESKKVDLEIRKINFAILELELQKKRLKNVEVQ